MSKKKHESGKTEPDGRKHLVIKVWMSARRDSKKKEIKANEQH